MKSCADAQFAAEHQKGNTTKEKAQTSLNRMIANNNKNVRSNRETLEDT